MKKAFTLVEFLIVITMLIILWSIAFHASQAPIIDSECVFENAEKILKDKDVCYDLWLSLDCNTLILKEYWCIVDDVE